MTKSELIERLTLKHELPPKQVEASVKEILEQMVQSLSQGKRVEI
ncbi:HU family DNA-binding protein, partial [Pantoea sp. SIMBA_072]